MPPSRQTHAITMHTQTKPNSSTAIYRWQRHKKYVQHTHTHPFNGPLSGTTRVNQYQKGNTNLDYTEARDSEWQWHQLGHMQVCTTSDWTAKCLPKCSCLANIYTINYTCRATILKPRKQLPRVSYYITTTSTCITFRFFLVSRLEASPK